MLPCPNGILSRESGRLEETVKQLLLYFYFPSIERSHHGTVARVTLNNYYESSGSEIIFPLSDGSGNAGHFE